MYEVEKRNVYRLLPTVTERHIQHGGHNTMTVSLAAQVMNSSSYQYSGYSSSETQRVSPAAHSN